MDLSIYSEERSQCKLHPSWIICLRGHPSLAYARDSSLSSRHNRVKHSLRLRYEHCMKSVLLTGWLTSSVFAQQSLPAAFSMELRHTAESK